MKTTLIQHNWKQNTLTLTNLGVDGLNNFLDSGASWNNLKREQFKKLIRSMTVDSVNILLSSSYSMKNDVHGVVPMCAVYEKHEVLKKLLKFGVGLDSISAALERCAAFGLKSSFKILEPYCDDLNMGDGCLLYQACSDYNNLSEVYPDVFAQPALPLIRHLLAKKVRAHDIITAAFQRNDEDVIDWLLEHYPFNKISFEKAAVRLVKFPANLSDLEILVDRGFKIENSSILSFLFQENDDENDRLEVLTYLSDMDFHSAHREEAINKHLKIISVEEFKLLTSKNYDWFKALDMLMFAVVESDNVAVLEYVLKITNPVKMANTVSMDSRIGSLTDNQSVKILQNFVLKSQLRASKTVPTVKLKKDRARI